MLGTSKSVWGFDPRSVPGCQLWLDGADSNTVTGTTSVTAWRDKSGNGFNGTAVNASVGSPIAPSYVTNSINGLSAITMSGTSYFTGSTNVNSTTLTCFFLGNCVYGTGGSTQQRILGLGVTGLDDYSSTLRPIPLAVVSGGTQLLSYRNANMASATVVSGTNFIGCCLFDGTSNYMYKDGTLGTQVASSGTFTTSIYGVGSDAGIQNSGGAAALGTNCLVGKVGEILVYNTALTTSQRQQVEGYLAHKWGLNGYYDSSIPLSIPGCQLWLDGADPAGTGVTPSNGATVSTWVDKSGNGLTVSAASSQPTYVTNAANGLGTVAFNGNQSLSAGTVTGDKLIGNTNSCAVFVVVRLTTSPSRSTPYSWDNTSTYTERFILHYDYDGTIYVFNGNLASGSHNIQSGFVPITNTSYHIISYFHNGSNIQLNFNGTTIASLSNYSKSSIASASRVFNVGSYIDNNSTWNMNGNIAEIIFFNTHIPSNFKQVEGYLARKWGFTSMYSALPSIHPFSSIRPHLRTFQPTDIPGCQLWLDGADSSTLVLSGSNVTQWSDKSGNGRNGTLFQNYPTYTTNRVNFNGTQGLATSLSPSTNIESGFVICGFTSVSSVNTLIGSFVSENGGRQFRVNNAIQTIKQDIVAVLTSGTSLENNTTYLCEYVNNGTTLTHYLNGNSYASGGSVTYTAGGNITSIGYRSNNNGYNEGLYGYIQEVLIFNTALTTSQRQSIEGYLAHKWGLTPSYSSTTPLSISGCTLWLDGADPAGTGVQPSNGATVSTWVDKSGNGLTVSAASSQPTYVTNAANGLGTVAFNGSQGLSAGTVTGTKLIGNTNSCAIYAVVRFENTSGRSIPYSWDDQTYEARFLLQYAEGNNIALLKRGATATTIPLINTLYYIVSYWQNGLNTQLNVNGTTIASLSNFSNNDISSFSRVFNVGYYANDPAGWNMRGNIAEIIFFNTHIPNDFKKVEGYLARKWGISISATLPSLHPFKSFPPAKAPMIIGLVNRWIFNNGSGSTVTDTVGGQNISLSGTYTWSSSVPNSEIALGSLSFNGYSGTGSAAVNATLQTSTYTMTLWYYHTGVSDPYGGNPMILQSGFNQNEAFSFATGGFSGTSKPYFYSGVYNGGFGRTFSSATPLNTWTHLAVTIGNSTYNAYQNGVLDSGNTNISITSGLPLTLNGSFIFAKGDSAYGNRFGGSLFDVRIYNRALSASEISQIYNGIG